MRQEFAAWYPPTQDEFARLWSEAVIVLDANVLLHLHRYSTAARDEFFSVLEDLHDRLWVPHQAALEYHENRPGVLADRRTEYSKMAKAIRDAVKDVQAAAEKLTSFSKVGTDRLLAPFHRAQEEALAALKEAEGPSGSWVQDPIRDRIAALLAGRVGARFDEEEHRKQCDIAEARFKVERPPGYLDATTKQGDRRYGDYLVWEQTLRHAAAGERSIILVTDDFKDDWWLRSAERALGPRPELRAEFAERSAGLFHMYNASQFLRFAGQHLRQAVSPELVSEVEAVARQTAEKERLSAGFLGTLIDVMRRTGVLLRDKDLPALTSASSALSAATVELSDITDRISDLETESAGRDDLAVRREMAELNAQLHAARARHAAAIDAVEMVTDRLRARHRLEQHNEERARGVVDPWIDGDDVRLLPQGDDIDSDG